MIQSFRRTRVLMIAVLALSMQLLVTPMVHGEDAAKATESDTNSTTGSIPASLADEIKALRSKVVQLESDLAQKNPGEAKSMSDSKMDGTMDTAKDISADASAMDTDKDKMGDKKMMGMKKGKMGDKKMMGMKKDKMGGMGKMGMKKGMGKMGRMPDQGGMSMPSSLPGFPGASHLYHIGETGFFLDHPEHITLTVEQQTQLAEIKEKALLADATFERSIDEAEQQLWVLTSADAPSIKKIESKVRAIEKLRGDRRLAFIRNVGAAAAALSDAQRKTLVGEYAPEESPPSSSPAE